MQKDILLIGVEDRLPLYQDAYEGDDVEFRVSYNLHNSLESIKEKLPNLILVDHEALGNNSIEICQTLKKYPGTQRIPLIFLVSRSNIDDLLEVLFIPVNDYLFLPLDTEDFRLRVESQLKLLELKDEKKLLSVEDKIEELEKLLKIFPDYNAARQELSDIYEKTGRIEDSLESHLKLAKEYYHQKNFGLSMEVITKMKGMLSKNSIQFSGYAQFMEALERCLQILGVK